MPTATDRYTIISSDCHAGGNHKQYRDYLDAAWIDEFDAWRGQYKNPFRDLQDDGRSRNWDDERRIREMSDDGVVAEVIFPNTVPPFFPTGVVIAPAPTRQEYPARLAGIRAHNRWLADFCSAHPARRAGLGQILLNDVDDAIADVRWAKDHGLAGMLLPGVAPHTGIDPLFAPTYDPLWAVCQELDFPVTHHGGGSGVPDFGRFPASMTIYIMEVAFFANRALSHLVMSGVFDRFPDLTFVLTEQGSSWIPDALDRMDEMHESMVGGKFGGELGPSSMQLTRRPSEYFAQNCYVGASFPSRRDAERFDRIGLDRVMWGSDYPHREGTYPYSKQSLRLAFSDWDETSLRAILGGNAARVYGFDLDALAPMAAACGPTVDEVATPLDHVPDDATSPAFTRS